MNGRGSERNKIWIAPHEAHVTAILDHSNDIAGEKRAFAARACWPVQNRAALEMSAAID